MTLTSFKAQAINYACNRLRDCLRRCDPEMPQSLRLQITHLVKEAIRKGYQGKPEIHPGNKKMAQWAKCSERQAVRNMRQIEQWGIAQPVSDLKGGKRATRYWIEPENVLRLAITNGANPSPDLIREIRALVGGFRGDMSHDMRGDICHDTCHPVLRSSTKLEPSRKLENAVSPSQRLGVQNV